MASAEPTSVRPGAVTIRDRRELPFFQVRLTAVRSIRDEVSGARRLRTIGFYALLCQLANEQRHTGQHRRLQSTYDSLAARAGIAKRNVKLMLDFLQHAGVVRYERHTDPQRGATSSTLHLLAQDGPWTAITVDMADRLAEKRAGGHLLRELGLIIVLLEFCVSQRDSRDGLSAEVTRSEIARQAGLTVDRIDQCNRLLQHAGVLSITRRRPANGGRNLASLYTIHEAPIRTNQGRETEPPAPHNGTIRAAEQNWQGRELELTDPANGTDRAAERNRQGGNSALQQDETRPSYAHAGSRIEETPIENPPGRTEDQRHGGEASLDPQDDLCRAFVEAWAPVLGDAPARTYKSRRSEWQAAAAELLDRHPFHRIARGFEQMLVDEVVGSRALTIPAFAKVADQLIARHHARQQQARGTWRERQTHGGIGWEHAKQLLERAIQRHGRDRRREALAELAAHDPTLVAFVEHMRWSTLCEQPIQFVERRYAELWAEIVTQARPGRQEPAI
jgi:hypothetical protein